MYHKLKCDQRSRQEIQNKNIMKPVKGPAYWEVPLTFFCQNEQDTIALIGISKEKSVKTDFIAKVRKQLLQEFFSLFKHYFLQPLEFFIHGTR